MVFRSAARGVLPMWYPSRAGLSSFSLELFALVSTVTEDTRTCSSSRSFSGQFTTLTFQGGWPTGHYTLSSHIGLFRRASPITYTTTVRGRTHPLGEYTQRPFHRLAAVLWSHVASKSPSLLTRRSLRPSTFAVTLCPGAPVEYPSAARKGDSRRKILDSWKVLRGEGGHE